jgi:hypothetical protein
MPPRIGVLPPYSVLLEELKSVGAGEADEKDVDVLLELRDIGAVIGRDQRRPELLHHLAAGVLEGALEAGVELVAVGDVVGDHGGALVFEFLGRVVAHGIATLRRGRGRAHEPGIGLALRHVLGGGDAERRDLLVADVVVDSERLGGRQRPDQAGDVLPLEEFLHLGARHGRRAGGIAGEELHRPPGEHVVTLLEIEREALLHLDAAGGERAGFHGEEADLHRSALSAQDRGRGDERARCEHALQDGAATDGHCSSLRLRFMARGFSHRLFSHQAGYHPYISGPILSRGSHPGGGSQAINFL